ncbi:MAG TPA: chemotaxis protein [Rhodospirillaceae bacterium]|nr:chemotaxis protein [Rhodospirillaceae bacterium]
MSEAARNSAENQEFKRDQVVKIIKSVINKVEAVEGVERETIYRELKNLHDIIEEARKEVGAARAGDISGKHIPTATDELDEVVRATAEATGTIMDACDIISTKAAEAGAPGEAITTEVMKIYEACSFQDITGQRIKKVVSTLTAIEVKVNALMKVLGEKMPGLHAEGDGGDEEDGRVGDARLLNGPQMKDKAISQAEIDKLLSQFD